MFAKRCDRGARQNQNVSPWQRSRAGRIAVMFLFRSQHLLDQMPKEDGRRFAKHTRARAAASQDRVRAAWVRRLVDATQGLSGALLDPQREVLNDALIKFEQCPLARTTAERLVLRGILLDVFLRLETALEPPFRETCGQNGAALSVGVSCGARRTVSVGVQSEGGCRCRRDWRTQ